MKSTVLSFQYQYECIHASVFVHCLSLAFNIKWALQMPWTTQPCILFSAIIIGICDPLPLSTASFSMCVSSWFYTYDALTLNSCDTFANIPFICVWISTLLTILIVDADALPESTGTVNAGTAKLVPRPFANCVPQAQVKRNKKNITFAAVRHGNIVVCYILFFLFCCYHSFWSEKQELIIE